MSWEQGLSPEQHEAACHFGQHARLLAGPGTGKTRAIASRVAYLVTERNIAPKDILALTFTRAAAAELRSRVSSIMSMGSSAAELPQISTLHSFALQMILRHGAGTRLPSPIRIADDYEERWIIEEDMKRILNLERVEEARDLIQQLSADWERLCADVEGWELRFPYPQFLGTWREHRTVFGYTLRAELVYQLKRALEEGTIQLTDPPRHILVDEYQDLNACDLSVIRSLTTSGAELYSAGDDDQSIYGFRYANPEGIRRFPHEYTLSAELTLVECKRCSQRILDIAKFVAQQDPRRIDKPLFAQPGSPPGEVHLLRFHDYTDEAVGVATIADWLVNGQKIAADQILVLLRNDRYQSFSSPIRVAFEARGLPSSAVENPLEALDEPQGRIFVSLLRLLENPGDSLAWRTLIKLRPNRLGDTACGNIYEIARADGSTFYNAIRRVADSPSIVGRQGSLIRSEYNAILAILAELQAQDQEDLRAFIDSMVAEHITEDKRQPISEAIDRVLEETGASSIPELLRGVTNPIRDAEQAKDPACINIMTMHQAKGLDSQAVFVVGAEDEYVPGRATGAEVDDERRLLYVSLTRARTHLFITHCSQRTGGQRHTGRTSGSTARTLTQFLSGGPLRSQPATEFLDSLRW